MYPKVRILPCFIDFTFFLSLRAAIMNKPAEESFQFGQVVFKFYEVEQTMIHFYICWRIESVMLEVFGHGNFFLIKCQLFLTAFSYIFRYIMV